MTQFASVSSFLTLGADVDQDAFRTWALAIEANIRDKLAATRNFYVSTSGNDANDGTVGAPWATLQKAADVVGALDTSVSAVIVNVADGTYAPVILKQPTGGGTVSWVGNIATPANVVISATGANAVIATGVRQIMRGFKITTLTAGDGLQVKDASILSLYEMEFGACAWAQKHILGNSILNEYGAQTISGGAILSYQCEDGGRVLGSSLAFTLTGTPAYSSQYAYAARNSSIFVPFYSYSGSVAGQRYSVVNGSTIQTFGGTLPGSTAGYADATSSYA